MKAEVINDFTIMGIGTIRKGTRLEVKERNTRYVYLNYYGMTLKCNAKDVKIIK